MKVNNFDNVAFIYDALAKLFFGSSLKRAQTYWLHKIGLDANVLIMGGGTGWIAQELLAINPSVKITMIDASKEMIARAQQRLQGKNVQVIYGDESMISESYFDVVILPFFLDLFSEDFLQGVIQKIDRHMSRPSLWIVTDFVSEKWWHRLYLWVMYRFFKITTNIEASSLSNWNEELINCNLTPIESKSFYGGFIKTCCYRV